MKKTSRSDTFLSSTSLVGGGVGSRTVFQIQPLCLLVLDTMLDKYIRPSLNSSSVPDKPVSRTSQQVSTIPDLVKAFSVVQVSWIHRQD